MRTSKLLVIGIISIGIIWMGFNVFAHGRGMGRGGGWDQGGQGWHQRGGNWGPNGGNLTDEEVSMLREKREAFFTETKGLRDSIIEKQQELQTLLAEDEPDMANASQIQKEISDLRSDLDQIRLNHRVEMQKTFPNMGRGYKSGGPMGGPMRGSGGPRGGGWCW
ncbi:MAG: periplasmic heavy metal sensor [Desulfobacteraceae bacterium]|nr:periplasmic heavy metal sensor [Desulfobacteraceae bacterium]